MVLIKADDRFFVAGARGMAGSAINRALLRSGYHQLLTASRFKLDLLDGHQCVWQLSVSAASSRLL